MGPSRARSSYVAIWDNDRDGVTSRCRGGECGRRGRGGGAATPSVGGVAVVGGKELQPPTWWSSEEAVSTCLRGGGGRDPVTPLGRQPRVGGENLPRRGANKLWKLKHGKIKNTEDSLRKPDFG
jgi:hypothetical protein